MNSVTIHSCLSPQMVSSSSLRLFLIFLAFFSSSLLVSQSQSDFRPSNLALQVRKDAATNFHVATIYKRSQTPLQFLIDLNGPYLWEVCGGQRGNLLSNYAAPQCHSAQCSRAESKNCYICSPKTGPGCRNNACAVMSYNPVTNQRVMGVLAQDDISIQSMQGSNAGPSVRFPQFLFVCAPSKLLQGGVPTNVQGVAGFGHSPLALPIQMAGRFGFGQKFSLCLSSNPRQSGVIFFGEGPFRMQNGYDVSRNMMYTPLSITRQGEYYVQVTEIRVRGQNVPLEIETTEDRQKQRPQPRPQGSRFGGTMISTTLPFTVLHQSVYQNFVRIFTSQLQNIPRVQSVAPFEFCYDSRRMSFPRRSGAAVPAIELVFGNGTSSWTMFGANSMVMARQNVVCLGFVNGGSQARVPVAIGAHQLEETFLHFDLTRSRLGISSSLLMDQSASCANFNSNRAH